MSGFLNKVQLIGNLGRDPEGRTTQGGKKVVTLSVATSESWKDQYGNRVGRTEWHRVVIWNERLGEIAEKYLTTGSKVFLEGKLATRKWQDLDGTDRYTTEIEISPYNGVLTFLTPPPENRNRELASGGTRAEAPATPPTGRDLDNEIRSDP